MVARGPAHKFRYSNNLPGMLRLRHDVLWLLDFLVFALIYEFLFPLRSVPPVHPSLSALPTACAFAFVAASLCRDPSLLANRSLQAPPRRTVALLRRPTALLACNLAILAALAVREAAFSRGTVAALGLCFIWPAATRIAVTAFFRGLARSGALRNTILLVGTSRALQSARALTQPGDAIIELEHDGAAEQPAPGETANRMYTRLTAAFGVEPAAMHLDMIVFAEDSDPDSTPPDLIKCLISMPARIAILHAGQPAPEPTPRDPAKSTQVQPGRLRIIADRPIQGWGMVFKGAADRIMAALLLVLLAPLLLAISAAIAVDSPGPTLFRQTRTGIAGKPFNILKFRTMAWAGASPPQGQTSRNDRRITRLGHFLRRSSLDELPQLINVLCGEMSIIGPRPLAEALHGAVLCLKDLDLAFAARHRVKPGMTGWAQIHGSRGAVDTAEQMQTRLQWDLFYVAHWSLLIDLLILVKTPWILVRGENAF